MADDWALKEVLAPGSPERWFFRKNLAPAVAPAHPGYRHITYLTFSYSPKDESGLPSKRDDVVLTQIEESVSASLEADGLSVQVGAALKGGVKDLLYYTRDPERFLTVATQTRHDYPQYRVQCEIVEDPRWSQYDEFP
jgi:hypothetical protein